MHECIAAQRKDFCHQTSRAIVNLPYFIIGFEIPNIAGMVKNRCLAKSIMDAAWSMFTRFLTYKAASAGKLPTGVNASGTSQECPFCGTIRKKTLSERSHHCICMKGMVIDRDYASSLVIRARAVGVATASPSVEVSTTESLPLQKDLSRAKEADSSQFLENNVFQTRTLP